jgi:hypothetical protein
MTAPAAVSVFVRPDCFDGEPETNAPVPEAAVERVSDSQTGWADLDGAVDGPFVDSLWRVGVPCVK